MASLFLNIPPFQLETIGALDTAFGSDIIQMIIHAGLVVKFVLFILFLFSILSWTIIFMKWRLLGKARQETNFFLDLFWEGTDFNKIYQQSTDLGFSPVAQLFKSGYIEFKRFQKIHDSSASRKGETVIQPLIDNLERALRRTSIDQNNRLEKALSFLATTGNTTPFIGLLPFI